MFPCQGGINFFFHLFSIFGVPITLYITLGIMIGFSGSSKMSEYERITLNIGVIIEILIYFWYISFLCYSSKYNRKLFSLILLIFSILSLFSLTTIVFGGLNFFWFCFSVLYNPDYKDEEIQNPLI